MFIMFIIIIVFNFYYFYYYFILTFIIIIMFIMFIIVFNFLGTSMRFSTAAAPVYSYQQCRIAFSPHPCQHRAFVVLLIVAFLLTSVR